MTTDPAAARSFYGAVVGWGVANGQIPGMEYWMFTHGEAPFASVDATAADVTANGGAVHVPPTDIPNVGRFAIVADPQGAVVAIYRSANPTSANPDAPSAVGCHDLYATDGGTAPPTSRFPAG